MARAPRAEVMGQRHPECKGKECVYPVEGDEKGERWRQMSQLWKSNKKSQTRRRLMSQRMLSGEGLRKSSKPTPRKAEAHKGRNPNKRIIITIN